MGKLYI